jgi:hypothetical protein
MWKVFLESFQHLSQLLLIISVNVKSKMNFSINLK